MRAGETFLKRLEERLFRMSGWLAARQHEGDQAGVRERHARLDALRRELARTRGAVAETSQHDLARVRATLDDLERDYDVPPPHVGLRRSELEAFRRLLQTTARTLRKPSNLDDPEWAAANAEYERAWGEVERAFGAEGDPASH
jgi:hypothetical protein